METNIKDCMSRKEIQKRIRSEENRIKWRKAEIDKIKSDIKATRRALAFWKTQLKKAKK